MTLEVRDLAYAAALVDTLGTLSLRMVGPSELPTVVVQGRFESALRWLGDHTGSKLTVVKRDYQRNACRDHCPEPHVHIVSTSVRWSVSGMKATIVLHNLQPYLRIQDEAAKELVAAGLNVGYKGQVVQQMKDLGWEIPDLKVQPRARIQLPPPDTGGRAGPRRM